LAVPVAKAVVPARFKDVNDWTKSWSQRGKHSNTSSYVERGSFP
jgi:hypothetical protein